jgi:hypothetical protein
LRSHEALTGLRVSADLQKQICLRKSAEPLWASLKENNEKLHIDNFDFFLLTDTFCGEQTCHYQ